jgi:hypothetical protein
VAHFRATGALYQAALRPNQYADFAPPLSTVREVAASSFCPGITQKAPQWGAWEDWSF